MSDPIKTADLCARCVFEYFNHCQGIQGGDCGGCEQFGDDRVCLCLKIKANTPCPHFEEVETNEAD